MCVFMRLEIAVSSVLIQANMARTFSCVSHDTKYSGIVSVFISVYMRVHLNVDTIVYFQT